jgi:RHS repeat-associated protein
MWVQERATEGHYSVPYKFTGKEQDPETGLYYFVARYYDPVLSRWISADPALQAGKYFPKPTDFDTEHDYFWYLENDKTQQLPGIGGVFNAINLDMYHYAGQNPVKLVDPDGNQSLEAIFWRMGITTDTERKINEKMIGSVETCYDSGYISGIIFGFVGLEFSPVSTNKYLPDGHKNSYMKGVTDGSQVGKFLGYVNIVNGLRKLGIEGGEKGLKTLLGSDKKNISDFAKGLSKAFLPNIKEIEFESKAEAAGFLVGTAIKDLSNLPSQPDNKK